MVLIVDVDILSLEGVVLLAFGAAVLYLLSVSGGLTVFLGAALVALVLLAAYYGALRLHQWAAGRRRSP